MYAPDEESLRKPETSLDLSLGWDRLLMTPDIISYKGVSIKTAEVDRMKWKNCKEVINFVSSLTSTIWVGTPAETIRIKCARFMESEKTVQQRFQLIFNFLWRHVCVRMIQDVLARLQAGERVEFGGASLEQDGVILYMDTLSKKVMEYKCPWLEVVVGGDLVGSEVLSIILRSSVEERAEHIIPLWDDDINNAQILKIMIDWIQEEQWNDVLNSK